MELQDGTIGLYQGNDRVSPAPAKALRWIDLISPGPAELELLRERFDFHPVTIEDCGYLDQRPKLEEYRTHLFLVTQGFSSRGDRIEELELQELHAFLGERCLVTVHETPIVALETLPGVGSCQGESDRPSGIRTKKLDCPAMKTRPYTSAIRVRKRGLRQKSTRNARVSGV